jgi:hypothetical protein
LDKKQQNPSGWIPLDNATASEKPKCDQCEYKAVSEKGLRPFQLLEYQMVVAGEQINQGQEAAPPLPPLYCVFVPWFNKYLL